MLATMAPVGLTPGLDVGEAVAPAALLALDKELVAEPIAAVTELEAEPIAAVTSLTAALLVKSPRPLVALRPKEEARPPNDDPCAERYD